MVMVIKEKTEEEMTEKTKSKSKCRSQDQKIINTSKKISEKMEGGSMKFERSETVERGSLPRQAEEESMAMKKKKKKKKNLL